jgi:hypothetical protein
MKILIVILIIIAIPLVLAIFTKKNYHIEKMTTINQPKKTVFDYIRMLKNLDNFSVWAKMVGNDLSTGLMNLKQVLEQ